MRGACGPRPAAGPRLSCNPPRSDTPHPRARARPRCAFAVPLRPAVSPTRKVHCETKIYHGPAGAASTPSTRPSTPRQSRDAHPPGRRTARPSADQSPMTVRHDAFSASSLPRSRRWALRVAPGGKIAPGPHAPPRHTQRRAACRTLKQGRSVRDGAWAEACWAERARRAGRSGAPLKPHRAVRQPPCAPPAASRRPAPFATRSPPASGQRHECEAPRGVEGRDRASRQRRAGWWRRSHT